MKKAKGLILMNEVDGQYNYPIGLPEDLENCDMLDVGTFHILLRNYKYAKGIDDTKKALDKVLTYIRTEYKEEQRNAENKECQSELNQYGIYL